MTRCSSSNYCNVFLLALAVVAIASVNNRAHAACLVGDILYNEGDSIGHIGLECLDKARYDGLASTCGPNGVVVDEEQIFTCSGSVPYCVQRGPRGWGNAVCLSEPPETTATTFLGEYEACGGGSASNNSNSRCEEGLICYTGLQDAECDEDCGDSGCPGVCRKDVTPSSPGLCGGFAGFACPPGSVCVDNKGDGCSPKCGGADCGGICLSTSINGVQTVSRPNLTRQECVEQGGIIVGDIGDGAIHRDDYICESSGEPPLGTIVTAPDEPIAMEGEVCCGSGGPVEMTNKVVCPDGQEPIPNTFCGRGPNRADCNDGEFCHIDPADRFAVCCPNSAETASKEAMCCDPKIGPGGCPDANGSFDGCWDEGGYCCSDGEWYADFGDGSNNCQDNDLENAKPCECTDYECCVYVGGELKTDASPLQCRDSRSGKTFAEGCPEPMPESSDPSCGFDCIDGEWAQWCSEAEAVLCPDGQKPIPDTFCGRGPDRADCNEDEFCHIDPTDRFAVCCPTSTTTEDKALVSTIVKISTIEQCRTMKRRICPKCKKNICKRWVSRRCNSKRQCRKKIKRNMRTCMNREATKYRRKCKQPRLRINAQARRCGVPDCVTAPAG